MEEKMRICPECLEPNVADAKICATCGAMMQEGELDEENKRPKNEEPQETTNAASPSVKDDKKEASGNRFNFAIRGFGIYILIYAISEVPRSLKIENPQERNLSLLSNFIYLVAGCLMVYPMVTDWLKKRKEKQLAIQSQDNSSGDEAPNPNAERISFVELDQPDSDPIIDGKSPNNDSADPSASLNAGQKPIDE